MDCIFCKIVKKEIDSKIIYEDDLIIALMDINPHAMGHILIIPKKHYNDYRTANNILNYMFRIANKIGDNIINKLNQKGYSLVINYGDAQEIKHLHLHLIPTNNETDYDINEIYKKIKMS